MVKPSKKNTTKLLKPLPMLLGMTFIAAIGTSCTNLADNIEGNDNSETGSSDGSDENTGNGTGNNSNNNNNEPHPTEQVDLEAILTSLGENVILPVYKDFQTAAVALQTSANDYAAAVASDSGDASAKLTALEAAWKVTMDAWQYAEMLQVGPAGSSSKIIAGDNIRDEIYSWPTVNSCRVDQELVEDVYSASSFFSDELVNVYGLTPSSIWSLNKAMRILAPAWCI